MRVLTDHGILFAKLVLHFITYLLNRLMLLVDRIFLDVGVGLAATGNTSSKCFG